MNLVTITRKNKIRNNTDVKNILNMINDKEVINLDIYESHPTNTGYKYHTIVTEDNVGYGVRVEGSDYLYNNFKNRTKIENINVKRLIEGILDICFTKEKIELPRLYVEYNDNKSLLSNINFQTSYISVRSTRLIMDVNIDKCKFYTSSNSKKEIDFIQFLKDNKVLTEEDIKYYEI